PLHYSPSFPTRRSSDLRVGPRLRRHLDGLRRDAAVDRDAQLEVPGGDVPAGDAHLLEHLGNEALTAETGLNRHNQQHIEARQDVDRKSTRLNSSHVKIS